MDVGERLDALENRLAVIERALKITPPADQVAIGPLPPVPTALEDRVAALEETDANLIIDIDQMGQVAGKVKNITIKDKGKGKDKT